MINNFNIIKSLLNFDSDYDFYFLQLIQRKKDNPTMTVSSRAIKSWIIKSIDELNLYEPDIINLANYFNARATILLNKRNFKTCSFELLSALATCLKNGDYIRGDKLYFSIIGKYSSDKNKKWIIDADDLYPHSNEIKEIISCINAINPAYDRYVETIPSKTGCHIIVKPFNPQIFKEKYPNIELHKDNPTNIYIP